MKSKTLKCKVPKKPKSKFFCVKLNFTFLNNYLRGNNQITSSSQAQMDHEMKSSEVAGQGEKSSLIEEDA